MTVRGRPDHPLWPTQFAHILFRGPQANTTPHYGSDGTGNPWSRAFAAANLALCLVEVGAYEEALEATRGAEELASEIVNPAVVSVLHSMRGFALQAV